MRRIMIALAAAIAMGMAAADVNDWVYTPETHIAIAPATAESSPETVDRSFWSCDWAFGQVFFGYGLAIIVR